jgi:hypothetical protein
MPFSGYPVFPASPRSEPVSERRSSRRLPLPYRAVPREPSAVEPAEAPRLAPTHPGGRQQPSWVSVLYSACGRESPQQRGYQVPPEPAHGVSTPTASRAAKGHSLDTPGLFRPGNALELSPSGPRAARRGGRVSASLPPVSFGAALWRSVRLRRVEPFGKPNRSRRSDRDPMPSWRFAPLRLSLPPPWALASQLPPLTCLEPSGRTAAEVTAEAATPAKDATRTPHLRVFPSGGPGCVARKARRLRSRSPKASTSGSEDPDGRVPAPLGFRTSSRSDPEV